MNCCLCSGVDLSGEILTEYVVTRWYRAPEIMLACKVRSIIAVMCRYAYNGSSVLEKDLALPQAWSAGDVCPTGRSRRGASRAAAPFVHVFHNFHLCICDFLCPLSCPALAHYPSWQHKLVTCTLCRSIARRLMCGQLAVFLVRCSVAKRCSQAQTTWTN